MSQQKRKREDDSESDRELPQSPETKYESNDTKSNETQSQQETKSPNEINKENYFTCTTTTIPKYKLWLEKLSSKDIIDILDKITTKIKYGNVDEIAKDLFKKCNSEAEIEMEGRNYLTKLHLLNGCLDHQVSRREYSPESLKRLEENDFTLCRIRLECLTLFWKYRLNAERCIQHPELAPFVTDSIGYFSNIDLKDHKLTPFQAAEFMILRYCEERLYRRYSTTIFKPYIVSKKYTHFYCPDMSVQALINMIRGSSRDSAWLVIGTTGGQIKHLEDSISKIDNANLPLLRSSRYQFSYRNGIYNLKTETFHEYKDANDNTTISCNYFDKDFCIEEFETVRLSPFFQNDIDPRETDIDEYKKIRYLNANYVRQRSYHDNEDIPILNFSQVKSVKHFEFYKEIVKIEVDKNSADWYKLSQDKIPAIHKIFDDQWKEYDSKKEISPEEREATYTYVEVMKRITFAMIGRLLWPLCSIDRWELHPTIIGMPGTGKSLLEEAIRSFYIPNQVVCLANSMQRDFGLAAFDIDPQPLLWYIGEITESWTIDPADFHRMTTGEALNMRKKHKDAVTEEFTTPGISFGNSFPKFNHDPKAMARRLFYLRFTMRIQDMNTQMKQDVLKEVPYFLLFCNHAYLSLVRFMHERQIRSPQHMWHSSFTERQDDYKSEGNLLEEFLSKHSAYLVFGAHDTIYCPEDIFQNEFSQWCQRNGRVYPAWEEKLYIDPFQKMGLYFDTKKTETFKYPRKLKLRGNGVDATPYQKTAHYIRGIDIYINCTEEERKKPSTDISSNLMRERDKRALEKFREHQNYRLKEDGILFPFYENFDDVWDKKESTDEINEFCKKIFGWADYDVNDDKKDNEWCDINMFIELYRLQKGCDLIFLTRSTIDALDTVISKIYEYFIELGDNFPWLKKRCQWISFKQNFK
jgi:hypothetical protein